MNQTVRNKNKVVRPPVANLTALTAVCHLRRGGDVMKTNETEPEKPSFWQLVFSQSKVNGALYMGEQLPGRNWNWPKNTYLQRRLRQVRWYQGSEKIQLN
jgi:hypothetical protein